LIVRSSNLIYYYSLVRMFSKPPWDASGLFQALYLKKEVPGDKRLSNESMYCRKTGTITMLSKIPFGLI
jgi:hypothetical protein